MHPTTRLTTIVLLLLSAATTAQKKAPQAAPSWPQWRGPNRDGISTEAGWSVAGDKVLWRKDIGMGYSTVSIAGGRLYTQGHDKEVGEDSVLCLDAMTGEEIWRHTYPCPTMAKAHSGGSLSTPSIDGPRVFAVSRVGDLFCFDAETGKVRWHEDLKEQYDLKLPTWGFACSPLVLDEKIVVNVGKVLAFDRKGKLLWKTGNLGHAYATAVDATFGKRKCLVVFSGDGLTILDRKSGKKLAQHEWKTRYDVNAATPIVTGDRIFISSGYGRGCAMLRFDGKKLEPAWESRVMRNHMSGCVLYEDHLYGYDEGTFKCLDLDGIVMWEHRGLGKCAFVIADGKLVLLGMRGELVIAEASPDGFSELSRAPEILPSRGRKWSTPVLCNGLIYCRDSNGELACVDRRAPTK